MKTVTTSKYHRKCCALSNKIELLVVGTVVHMYSTLHHPFIILHSLHSLQKISANIHTLELAV